MPSSGCSPVLASVDSPFWTGHQVHVVQLPNVRRIRCAVHAAQPYAQLVLTVNLAILASRREDATKLTCGTYHKAVIVKYVIAKAIS